MRTTPWGKLVTARPVNHVASRVTSPGFRFEPEQLQTQPAAQKENSAPVVEFTTREVPPGTKNLIKRKRRIGKLTVIGFFRKVHPARMNLWIVQCECGKQELRRQRWILNPKAE